jgi:hypothetical protein
MCNRAQFLFPKRGLSTDRFYIAPFATTSFVLSAFVITVALLTAKRTCSSCSVSSADVFHVAFALTFSLTPIKNINRGAIFVETVRQTRTLIVKAHYGFCGLERLAKGVRFHKILKVKPEHDIVSYAYWLIYNGSKQETGWSELFAEQFDAYTQSAGPGQIAILNAYWPCPKIYIEGYLQSGSVPNRTYFVNHGGSSCPAN